MRYRRLGRTGLKVSEIGLGCMTFGEKFFNIAVVDQTGADAMVARSIEAGVNFFDTADIYSFGQSEEMLGKAIRNVGVRRDAVVVATKVRGPMSQEAWDGTGDVNNLGLSRHHVMAACEASLRRLGLETIDLYQVHGFDVLTPMEETLRALEDLVTQGKVRYVGCSNWSARHLARALALCDERHWARFASLQAYYSLAGRDLEHELVPLCREEGLGILPWSPLAGGFLTGKYRRDGSGAADGRREEFDFPPIDTERGYDTVDLLETIANERDATIARVALAWCLTEPAVSSVLIGARSMAQLEDNLLAADLVLSEEETTRLSEATAPPTLYPQWMIERQNAGR
jgi:aryl-alcohol dehydrogenase-like predicted oxidoreductase